MLFARKCGDKYAKKLMDTAAKTGIDAAKTVSKRKGDLIGNKIDDKITSLGKAKSKEKGDERQEIYIPLEKRQHIIDDLRLF